jgi:hypothetical protein
MNNYEHLGNIPTLLKGLRDIPASVSSTAAVFTMLKVPVRPVLVAALVENRVAALAAKTGGSAKRKHVELIQTWLVDIGCGHDLISKRDLKNVFIRLVKAESPLTFNTANGKTTAKELAPLYCSELKEELLPHVLESTPPVLSVGRRCMEMGYSFVWLSDQDPYFVCPDGMIVELEVRDNIPYLQAGSKDAAPKLAVATQSVPCAASPNAEVGEDAAAIDPGGPSDADHDSDGLADDSEEFEDAPNPKRDLKAEAMSIEHRLHHRVKNPHCDACNRSTMKNKKSHMGGFQTRF